LLVTITALVAYLAPLTGVTAAEEGLATAYSILSSKRFVDLSHAFDSNTPVWEGFGQATLSAAADPETQRPYTIEQDGFHSTVYTLVGQYGTHVDPPAHFDPTGKTQDRIPLSQMILPLVVFDITPVLRVEPSHALTVADIRAWEKEHGTVPQGAFAALRTDMHKDFDRNPERFKRHPFPAWSLSAVRFLFEERGVTAIGHESLDTDSTDDLESEAWLLRHGHWQIEVMANLDQVPPRGSLIVVTWPKVKNGLGFPARAFAITP
jgi:kynurenine formamidase